MEKIVLTEISRIHEIMGVKGKSILKEATTPNPQALEKIFEILGLRMTSLESDIEALEKKIVNNTASDYEQALYKEMESAIPGGKVTAEEVEKLISNPNNFEKFESVFEKAAETNPQFRDSLIKAFESVNPTVRKLYETYNFKISNNLLRTDKTKKIAANWIEQLDKNETLPDFIKNNLKEIIKREETSAIKKIEENVTKWKDNAGNMVTELSAKLENLPSSSYEVLKTEGAELKVKEALEDVKKMIDGIDFENDETFNGLINLKSSYEKLTPDVWDNMRKNFKSFFDAIWPYISCSKSKYTEKKINILRMPCLAVVIATISKMLSYFPSFLKFIGGGLRATIEVVMTIFSEASKGDTPTPPTPPTPTPSVEPTPGTLEHFKKTFSNGVQGKDNTHFKSSNESDIQYYWNTKTNQYAIES